MVGAVAEDGDAPTGPLCAAGPRTGKAKKQYCWWITMSFPYPETVARLGLKTPDDFTPDTFLEMVRAAHVARGIQLDEAVVFTEKHQCTNAGGERLKHLNALVRTNRSALTRPKRSGPNTGPHPLRCNAGFGMSPNFVLSCSTRTSNSAGASATARAR